VTVGSKTNVSIIEEPRRAAISIYNLDGSNHRIFASGLRNPTGITINPKTGKIWTAVNERDRIGDDLVPDYVTSVTEGGFYGFPFSYIGGNIDPRRKEDVRGEAAALVKRAIVPDVLLESHSAALGLRFYDGKMFPKKYRGDLFVALHGSWNRSELTGYKIIRIKFDKSGRPKKNEYEDFVTGWLPDSKSNEVWGRPVGVLVIQDGSMLISDDKAKRIWRIKYGKGNG
jgi:glucose/arabinose dehydrogenase